MQVLHSFTDFVFIFRESGRLHSLLSLSLSSLSSVLNCSGTCVTVCHHSYMYVVS